MLQNNYTTIPECKYRLPCGWCDRKNSQCTEIDKIMNPLVINDIPEFNWRNVHIPEACRTCSSHPSNGGSGLCSCSLAYPEIDNVVISGDSLNGVANSAVDINFNDFQTNATISAHTTEINEI